MKKIFIMLMFCFLLTGCNSKKDSDYKEKLIDYNTNLKMYELEAKMKIIQDDKNTIFDICVSYLQPNYYKVEIKNEDNNHVQVIVKNDDGVYVLTPSLNKQFKFNSDWPLNSTHIYLFQSVVKDIANDNNSSIVVNKDTYTITSKVNFKTHSNFKTQKATFSKKNNTPISNIVYDTNNNPVIEITFVSFSNKAKLTKNDFLVEVINKTIQLEMGEGILEGDLKKCVPTIILNGYNLQNSIINSDYTLYTYYKDDDLYAITTVVTDVANVMVESREYDDVILLNNTLGFVSENSLSFYQDNLFVTLYQENFNLDEMMMIANSYNK